ncbi:MAG: hypothetical protein WCW31_03860 [Patescibacteria group bacterium]|jgi:hypothetical protein
MHRTIHAHKPGAPEGLKHKSTDMVWAVVTIFSLPILALSFTALGIDALLSFILACAGTFLIIVLEAIVRGQVWFFNDEYRHIFEHKDTAFRILIVAGGILLVLQTFLIVELLRNPEMDRLALRMIVNKQCNDPKTPEFKAICPFFKTEASSNSEQFKFMYSLESAAKSHLIPTSPYGVCATLPINSQASGSIFDIKYFARCTPWPGQATTNKIIIAEFTSNQNNFYTATTWQEEDSSMEFQNIMQDTWLLKKLDAEIANKHQMMLRNY